MGRRLTAKQEKFIDGVADGLSYAEAYRRAYNAGNMAVETIANKASFLANREDIGAIIVGRRKTLADKSLWNREQALGMLRELAVQAQKNAVYHREDTHTDCYNASAACAAIKAIEQANKMCGYSEPEKQEVTHSGTIRVVIDDE